jgi:hypothetical protein
VSPELGREQVCEILALERIEGVALVAKPASAVGEESEKKKKKKRKKGNEGAAELCVVTAGERGVLRAWDASSGKEILPADGEQTMPGEPPAAELVALHSFPQRPAVSGGGAAPGLLAVTVEQNLVVRAAAAPTFPLETVLVGTLDEINDAQYCRAADADAAAVRVSRRAFPSRSSSSFSFLSVKSLGSRGPGDEKIKTITFVLPNDCEGICIIF